MMRRAAAGKRLLSLLLCTVLLIWPGVSSQAAPTVFFAAVDYNILPLSDNTMPIRWSGAVYAPYGVFTGGTGLFASVVTSPRHYVTLFGLGKTLTFDVDQNIAFELEQEKTYAYNILYISGRYYLPVDEVCSHFGLSYNDALETKYGPLLRIRTAGTRKDDQSFLTAAASKLDRYYEEYTASGETAPPVPVPSPGETPPEETAPPGRKIAYLTFDDGPKVETTWQILDILDEYQVKATFFLQGVNMNKDEDAVRRIVGSGHAVGLHSYTHRAELFFGSPEGMLDELTRTNDALYRVAAVRTRLVRVPFGSTGTTVDGVKYRMTPELYNAMNENGFRFWDWNVDSGDSKGSATPEKVAAATIEALKNRQKAAVILFHDKALTVEALPAILEYMKAENYIFRVITESDPAVTFSR